MHSFFGQCIINFLFSWTVTNKFVFKRDLNQIRLRTTELNQCFSTGRVGRKLSLFDRQKLNYVLVLNGLPNCVLFIFWVTNYQMIKITIWKSVFFVRRTTFAKNHEKVGFGWRQIRNWRIGCKKIGTGVFRSQFEIIGLGIWNRVWVRSQWSGSISAFRQWLSGQITQILWRRILGSHYERWWYISGLMYSRPSLSAGGFVICGFVIRCFDNLRMVNRNQNFVSASFPSFVLIF